MYSLKFQCLPVIIALIAKSCAQAQLQNNSFLTNGSTVTPTVLDVDITTDSPHGDILANAEVLIGPAGGQLRPLVLTNSELESLRPNLTVAPINSDLTSRTLQPPARSIHRSLGSRGINLRRHGTDLPPAPRPGLTLQVRVAQTQGLWMVLTYGQELLGRAAAGISPHQQLYNIITGISQHVYQVVAYENQGDAMGHPQAFYGRQTTQYSVVNEIQQHWTFLVTGLVDLVTWDEVQIAWDAICSMTYFNDPVYNGMVSSWTLYQGDPDSQQCVQLATGFLTGGHH